MRDQRRMRTDGTETITSLCVVRGDELRQPCADPDALIVGQHDEPRGTHEFVSGRMRLRHHAAETYRLAVPRGHIAFRLTWKIRAQIVVTPK